MSHRPGYRVVILAAFSAAGCGPSGGGASNDLSATAQIDLAAGADGGGGDAGPAGCGSDQECAGAKPRCDKPSGQCVPCLPVDDNCPAGTVCVPQGGSYACATGCKSDPDCNGMGSCCGHVCLDTSVDRMNCGGCGRTCAGGQVCCASACSDTASDVKNCGGCGRPCPAVHGDAACAAGVCSVAGCNAGFGDCNLDPKDGCETDLTSDPKNCSACGMACALPNGVAGCTAGQCVVGMCNPGFGDCNLDPKDGCETQTSSDLANCGGCGSACAAPANASAACVNGGCGIGACAIGYADCDGNPQDGCEVNTAADTGNCGGCGKACPAVVNGSPTCAAGACGLSCKPSFKDCDGVAQNGCEASLLADPQNCNGCGKVCPPVLNGAPACTGGVCGEGSCNAPFKDCDGNAQNGCEVNTSSDAKNCGVCGKVCPPVLNGAGGCAGSACGVGACNGKFADCDMNAMNGCEVNTDGDPMNCGGCGVKCPSVANGSAGCVGGKCTVGACNAPFADCDKNAANGCEADTSKDGKNCGGCGTVCPGTCGTGVAADLASLPVGWSLNGAATFDANAKSLVLAPAQNGQVGTFFWKNPIKTDAFDLSFDYQIGGGTGADGLAFVIQQNGANAVGAAGGGLGVYGLTGFGVELDTYNNGVCGDQNSNHVAIDALSDCGSGLLNSLYVNGALPFALRNTGVHTVAVHFDKGVWSVQLDGVYVVSQQAVQLQGQSFPSGQSFYYGFGAATGGLNDRHEIRNVKLSFPTARCL